MNIPERTEATRELRERWVNDIGGALGSLALFFMNVGLESSHPSTANICSSALCLVAAANFAGAALDKGGQISRIQKTASQRPN